MSTVLKFNLKIKLNVFDIKTFIKKCRQETDGFAIGQKNRRKNSGGSWYFLSLPGIGHGVQGLQGLDEIARILDARRFIAGVHGQLGQP